MSISKDGKQLYNETRRIIRKAKSNGRLVLFVGAGASVDPGMPLWGDAIKQIASKLPLIDKDQPYDSLKIPQYYYNSRGKKEYTQLMREIFQYGMPLKTTLLHKKLIECQADTIITTNYDHLIEQAAEENAEVRYVISKDADLPYKNSARELIKMHGDFENDNFVLKEDDYLQYSSNFRLIETYIKSLIGSKVVLFVGYSLNDPDVKQIFTWVKEVLQDDFQRAYLILSKTSKNEIERDYFRNLGVNIIYTSEIVDDWDNKSHTDQLVEFFDYLLEDEEEKILDQIYNELKPLQDLNYVYGKYVRNALRDIKISCEDYEIDLSRHAIHYENDEKEKFKLLLWTYLESEKIPEGYTIDGTDWNKLKVIKKVLGKSCFKSARREIDRKYCRTELQNDSTNQFDDLIYMFDYQKLNDLKNNNAIRLADDFPELYMQQAYICALLNDYFTAYNCLKNASKIFYKNKNYTWYFLAEFNRKYVGKVCTHPFVEPSLTDEERNQLEIELKAIDIERILETIPELGHNHNEYLRELSDFKTSYTLFYDMFSDSIKVNEQAKTAYSFFSGIAAYEKLRNSAQDYNNYETCNYIILDRYNEVRSIFLLYLRSIIASVVAEDIPDLLSAEDTFSTGNIKQDCLTDFDFYIMLRYLNQSDFKKLIKEYEIKVLPANEDALRYIENIADSMFNAKKYIKRTIFTQDIFWVYLEIVSHLNISEALAIKILDHLSGAWNEIDLMSNKECINRFIVNLCKEKYYDNPNIVAAASKIINNILDILIQDLDSHMHFINMLNNLLYICNQNGKAYCDLDRISKIASTCKMSLCANIYANLGEEAQKPIKTLFESWVPDANATDYCLYCDVVLSKIQSPDVDIEKDIFSWIKTSANEQSNEKNPGIKIVPKPCDYSSVIQELVNLYLNDQIGDIEGLREVVAMVGDSMSQWLLNVDKFDYSQFDCNWLNLCRSGLLRSIAQNDVARKSILIAYKRQYESKAVLSKVNEIIIEYFISEPSALNITETEEE